MRNEVVSAARWLGGSLLVSALLVAVGLYAAACRLGAANSGGLPPTAGPPAPAGERTPTGGMTLPSPLYLEHKPQYLPDEGAAKQDARGRKPPKAR